MLLRRNGPIALDAVGRVRLRTLPTDIDLFRHMNNGRYASLFDLGRFDLLVRAGFWDIMRVRGWYPVVASESFTFRRSLRLWQRFTVESRVIGHDDRSVYLVHRAVVRGEIYAEAIVRGRFLRVGGGTVPHEELFGALDQPIDFPPLPEWVTAWAEASALPSTRRPAPSTWA